MIRYFFFLTVEKICFKIKHTHRRITMKGTERWTDPLRPTQTLWFLVIVPFTWNDAVDQHWESASTNWKQLTGIPANSLTVGESLFLSIEFYEGFSGHSSSIPGGIRVTSKIAEGWLMRAFFSGCKSSHCVALPTKDKDITFFNCQGWNLKSLFSK